MLKVSKNGSIESWRIVTLVLITVLFSLRSSVGQENQDPTAQSDIIKQTMSKIRDIEKLESYIQRNQELTEANKALQEQVASINKQVAKLTADMADQQNKIRKQLLQMPSFELKAKVLGNGRDMATLKYADKYIRIRVDTKMSLPVADGIYVLMHVKKITKDMIELHFPELERDLFLYD